MDINVLNMGQDLGAHSKEFLVGEETAGQLFKPQEFQLAYDKEVNIKEPNTAHATAHHNAANKSQNTSTSNEHSDGANDPHSEYENSQASIESASCEMKSNNDREDKTITDLATNNTEDILLPLTNQDNSILDAEALKYLEPAESLDLHENFELLQAAKRQRDSIAASHETVAQLETPIIDALVEMLSLNNQEIESTDEEEKEQTTSEADILPTTHFYQPEIVAVNKKTAQQVGDNDILNSADYTKAFTASTMQEFVHKPLGDLQANTALDNIDKVDDIAPLNVQTTTTNDIKKILADDLSIDNRNAAKDDNGLLPMNIREASFHRTLQTELPFKTEIQESIYSPRWGDGLQNNVMWLVNQNIQRADIHLNPPDLGPIEIRVSIDKNEAKILFTSQVAEVRDLVDSNKQNLKETLQQAGIKAEVNVAHQNAKDSQERFHNEAITKSAKLVNIEETPIDSNAVAIRQGLIDDYA